MNSDPYDSAAWRSFGMLDADETAIFDDTMREDPTLRKYALEIDRLSAAIAASTTNPIDPGAGQLHQIQKRLRLSTSGRYGFWLAITGWTAAAAMALILILGRNRNPHQTATERQPLAKEPTTSVAGGDKPTSKVVTKRLTQEIEVLRENLENFHQRDQVMFAAVPGMALPTVMTMTPPGIPAGDTPIATLLGDAMRASAATHGDTVAQDSPDAPETPAAKPSAMSIYDTARDFGTLVVNNLPDAGGDQVYNLWVIIASSGKPVYVGSLPPSSATGGDSFDFSLGSTLILPSGFVLTQDPPDAPATPTDHNTILQGPPLPAR